MTQKLVARQSVAALLKKADIKVSTLYPSSSKYTRDTGIVIEPCSLDGEQHFKRVPTRLKGRRGYYSTTKDVLIEEVVRIYFHTTTYSLVAGKSEGDVAYSQKQLDKAFTALVEAGYKVEITSWGNGPYSRTGFLVTKESN